MKDKSARILAIIALVFIVIFSVMLVMTLIDYRMLGGSVGFIALGTGVFALVIFFALKADGRGFSMTKINNEIEMQKLEEAMKAREAEENSKNSKNSEDSKNSEKSEELAEKSDSDEEKE